MARVKTTEEWLQVYATKPLSRSIYVALRDAGPSNDPRNVEFKTHWCFPTQGMLQAERMGFVERVHTDSLNCHAFRRTPAGDTFFPQGRPYDTYDQHLREQQAKAARADRLARGES